MLNSLKKLFSEPAGNTEQDPDTTRRLAAAALLIEVSRADFTQDADEERAMAALLKDSLQLSQEDVDTLLREASARVDNATSLYEFTRLVNEHYSVEEKNGLIGAMWRVAYADSELNKYEEHLIRRVAELIYVPHEEFIRSKLRSQEESGTQ
jgi:uncharacterized tellurite resistance protein B-like protein